MSKNYNFYEQNKRFARLIEYYGNKAGDEDVKSELWLHLWILQNTSIVIPSDNYLAVCLRNKFLDICRQQKKHVFFALEKDVPEVGIDLDLKIDIKTALEQLKADEKSLIESHFFQGFTYDEIAKKDGTTRQAKSQKANRILLKIRDFF